MGRAGTPDQASDNGIWTASLLDLAAAKMSVIQKRAEKKDYLDIHAILKNGLSLENALAAACAVYGTNFNPAITLKALTDFQDGDLPTLPQDVKTSLINKAVKINDLPHLPRLSDNLGV